MLFAGTTRGDISLVTRSVIRTMEVVSGKDGRINSLRRRNPRGDPPCDTDARYCRFRTPLILNEFDTTLTELSAIAAAAIIGFSSPNAASGIPTIL